MSQQHKIMRMVLELRGCPEDAAPQVQAGLRRAHQERLLPLIDRICGEQGADDQVHRIERLEIDLGEVPLHALEDALGERFADAFARGLTAAIRDAPAGDADLELFGVYIATGTLPWWADLADRGLLAASLRRLLRRAPRSPWQAMDAAPDPGRVRRRLARALPDDLLDELVRARRPELAAAGPESASVHGTSTSTSTSTSTGAGAAWLPLLEAAARRLGHAPHAMRHLWWEELLAAAAGSAPADAPALLAAVLRRMAQRIGVEERVLIDSLGTAPAALRHGWESIARSPGIDATAAAEAAPAAAAQPWRDELASVLTQIEREPLPSAALWSRLLAAIAALPAERREPARTAVDEAARLGPPAAAEARRMLVRQLRRLCGLAADGAEDDADAMPPPTATTAPRPPAPGQDGRPPTPTPTPAPAADAAAQAAPPLAAAAALPPPAARRAGRPAPPSLRFSAADEVYVDNAGLVVLWPFLPRFFARLDLTRAKQFIDAAAAHRAAGLLQFLAAADESPPEHLLALNKLLCGLDADEVFDFGPAVTPAEAEECHDLLTAVIEQAPILREMSVAGFRGSFLLRKGQLGAQGDHWLLRVERETHDVVLDRFPWGVNPVKLPWMRALLQVQW